MRGAAAGGGRNHRPQSKLPFASPATSRRDSDSSFCSSRLSSAGGPPPSLISDRASQASALRQINAYLSSLDAGFSLKPPLPSARDITAALRLLLHRLDFDIPKNNNNNSLDDDLLTVLRHLNCPFKLNRSALKAPGTPHSFPALLSVLHWLTRLARFADHHLSSLPPPRAPTDILGFTSASYSLFIGGDDEAVAELDEAYLRGVKHEADAASARVEALEKELEEKLSRLKGGPSRKEELERERGVLMEDARKFEAVVDSFKVQVGAMERGLGDLERELEAKERESERVREENEVLRKRIEGQAVNARDVERMKREIAALDREITEAESGRNAMEEKGWELDREIGRKWKELEEMAEQCNQAMRKLKLGDGLQYVLNPKGSTPAEVMGIDYKNILKPSLAALYEDTKKTSVSKIEELMALQQQSRENTAMIEEKKGILAALQSKVDEDEARVSALKKEIEDHASKCATEAAKVQEVFARKEHQLSILEKEAAEYAKNSEQKLQDAIKETDEETQLCAGELLALIDSVSEYKESMESIICGMKIDLMEAVKFVGEAKASAVSAKIVAADLNRSPKRARYPSLAI